MRMHGILQATTVEAVPYQFYNFLCRYVHVYIGVYLRMCVHTHTCNYIINMITTWSFVLAYNKTVTNKNFSFVL